MKCHMSPYIITMMIMMCPWTSCAVWFGLVRFGLAGFGLAWLGLVSFGLAWFGLTLFGLAWFGLVWLVVGWLGLAWFALGWLSLAWGDFAVYFLLRFGLPCNISKYFWYVLAQNFVARLSGYVRLKGGAVVWPWLA